MKRIRHLEHREIFELDLAEKKIVDWSFFPVNLLSAIF